MMLVQTRYPPCFQVYPHAFLVKYMGPWDPGTPLPLPLLSGHWEAPSAALAVPAAQQPARGHSSAGFGCVEGSMENPAPFEIKLILNIETNQYKPV